MVERRREAAAPKQLAAPNLPAPGADGQDEVAFPDQKKPVTRLRRRTVSTDLRRECRDDPPHFELAQAQLRPQGAVAVRALAGCLNHPAICDRDVKPAVPP